MPSVLIMVAHRPRRSPSQRYRFEQYLPHLENKGFIFTWSYLLNENDDIIFYSKGNLIKKLLILCKAFIRRLKDVRCFSEYDIIFIQREAFFLGTSYFERKAAKSGKKVIFDFDDAIWLPDTSPGNKKWEWLKRPLKFYEIAGCATKVIAGSQYLAGEALKANKNVVVIPTTINTEIHKPLSNQKSSKITIGWSGSLSTTKHFEELLPVLKKIKKQFPEVQIKVVGDASYKNDLLGIEGLAWTEDSEVKELNSFDIGVMPIPHNEWSKGKCGLKALAYMACEIPVVASAVGVNTEIIKHEENGLLANTEEEWFSCLERLMLDADLRKKIGKAGRKTVEERYSVTANFEKYLQVFEQ